MNQETTNNSAYEGDLELPPTKPDRKLDVLVLNPEEISVRKMVVEAMEELQSRGVGRFISVSLNSSTNGSSSRMHESAGYIGSQSGSDSNLFELNTKRVAFIIDLPPSIVEHPSKKQSLGEEPTTEKFSLPRHVLVNLSDGRILAIQAETDQYNQGMKINRYLKMYGPDAPPVLHTLIDGFPHDARDLPQGWDFMTYVLGSRNSEIEVIADGASDPEMAIQLFIEAKENETTYSLKQKRNQNIEANFGAVIASD